MNKTKKIIFSIFALSIVSLLISSCGGPKKCNGKRGTRTEMGVM